MKNSWILCLLLILPIFAQPPTQPTFGQKPIATAKIGDEVKGIAYKVDQGKAFHLFAISNLQKKYLFFSLHLDPIYSHVDIKMSIYKEYAQAPFMTCPRQEIDSCYISRQTFSGNQSLIVIIQAGQQCEYLINSYWSDLQHIKINQEIKFMFSKSDQKQIYHLELNNSDFEILKIIIKPETRRYIFDQVKMFGAYGEKSLPSSSKYDFKSLSLWEDAEGVYLTKAELKQTKMNLILYGATETVYTLVCTISNKTYNKIAINSRTYEYLDSNNTHDYHVDFKGNEVEYEQYVFRVAIFNGDINLQFYSDKQKTVKINERSPYMYMGDIQYIFFKEEVNSKYPQGIYVKAIAKNMTSSYMIEFEGRGKLRAIELHEHIYDFIPIDNSRQIAYFKVSRYSEERDTKLENINVVFTLVKVLGSIGIQFRKCIQSEELCLGNQLSANSHVITTEQREVGQKITFTLTLTQDFWKNVNIVEKDAMIIVVLTSMNKEPSFVACEFNVGNRPQFLRQNKPIQSHLVKNEFKAYKYITQDEKITKVKVFISKIKGSFKSFLLRNEPTLTELTTDTGKADSFIYEITANITSAPIVIVINGVQSSTYSIVLQPIYDENVQINSITLSEDVEFKLKIGPNKYEIYEIIPILAGIYFKYKSTGALHVCILNDKKICSTFNDTLRSQGEINIPSFHGRSLFIKIRNPSHVKTVQVSSIFHSKKEEHCQNRDTGILYKQGIKAGQCLSSILSKGQDYEILIIREELGSLNYNLFLCDKVLNYARKQSGQQRYNINKQEVELNCNGHPQPIFSFIISEDKIPSVGEQSKTVINIKYLIQSTNGFILLPDGVAYHGKEVIAQSKVKTFVYSMMNKIDTSIILQTSNRLSFKATVVDEQKRNQIANIPADRQEFASEGKQYELGGIHLKLLSKNLASYKCANCLLVISVYSKEELGEQVQFTIEVTQNYIELEQGEQKKGFLLEKSIAYYSFNAKAKGNVLIEVADNNNDCAQIFLGITEYPNEQTSLQKSYDGHLLFSNSGEQMLYVSVRARQTCSYFITASLSENGHSILKLQRGSIGQVSLQEGETHYFTFKHHSQKSFKILTLLKYGQVQLYLNKTNPHDLSVLMQKPTIPHANFTTVSDKYSQLTLDKKSKEFCKGCYYILAVEAVKHTEGSVFLGDDETKIPLAEQKLLNDYLPEIGSVTKGEFFSSGNVILEVNVKNGKVEIIIDMKSESRSATFARNELPQEYNLSISDQNLNFDATSITVKALEPETAYSLRFRQSRVGKKDEKAKVINTAEPNYLHIEKDTVTCMSGFFKAKTERLFISFAEKEKAFAKNLMITGKISGNSTRIAYDTTKNVISCTFVDLLTNKLDRAVPFEICLLHKESSLSVTLIQSEEIALLPQNIETMVIGEQIFDIFPEGDFLLDIFECKGSSLFSFGKNKSELLGSKPKLFEIAAMPDQTHAARITAGSNNILLKIDAQLALVRWLDVNEQKEKGIGYYLYKAGNLKYNSQFGKVDFIVEPLLTTKKTKTVLSSVLYILYVSNSESDLKSATMCQDHSTKSVTAFRPIYLSQGKNTSKEAFSYEVQKSKFSEKYSTDKNLYFSVVADAIVELPSGELEDYRFIYNYQELPSELFLPNQLEVYDQKTIIIAFGLFIAALVILTFVCTRIIIPLVGRFRNQVLVDNLQESHEKQQDDGELQPPPSSDRQAIQAAQSESNM